MTQTLIEKLEGLMANAFQVHETNTMRVIDTADLRAIIEQAKVECEPSNEDILSLVGMYNRGQISDLDDLVKASFKLALEYAAPQDQTALIRELVEALKNQRDSVTSHYVTENCLDALITRAKEAIK